MLKDAGLISIFLVLFGALGCQQKPTQGLSTEPIFPVKARASEMRELFKKDPVIVDVRSAFEFGLSRVPQSVHLPWQDFTQKDSDGGRVLVGNYGDWARRLATYGISPDKDVIILGDESKEEGAAGRLAWTLSLVGIDRVHPFSIQDFRQLNFNQEAPLRNTNLWLPKTKNDLYITHAEWLVLLGQRKLMNTATSGFFKEQLLSKISRWHLIVLDSSLSDEQNLNWSSVRKIKYAEVFSAKGEIAETLQAKELLSLDRGQLYLIVCANGVKSSALAWKMGRLGFKNVVIVDSGIVR